MLLPSLGGAAETAAGQEVFFSCQLADVNRALHFYTGADTAGEKAGDKSSQIKVDDDIVCTESIRLSR